LEVNGERANIMTNEFKGPYGDPINYSKLPGHMQGAMRRYIEQGELPGDFLSAVLCNDLMKAVRHADSVNIDCLPLYASFLYNEAPSGCYGSSIAMHTYAAAQRARYLTTQQQKGTQQP
jgi:hypothetical protein